MRLGGLLAERPEPERTATAMKELAVDPDDGGAAVAAWGWDFPRGVAITGYQLRVDPARGIVVWVLQDRGKVVHEGVVPWDAVDAKTGARRPS